MKTVACIDLGTNTFHLLIVSVHGDRFTELYRRREYVILAEEGIATIGDRAIQRAKAAIDHFKKALEEYSPEKLSIIGTEALRKASNGQIIRDLVISELGQKPEIINGKREAELILKGTQLMVDMSKGQCCLMDIGGGSVEFILVQNGKTIFSDSYPIGVNVLYNKFHKSDPIQLTEIAELSLFVNENITDFTSHLRKMEAPISLVGASGSYEVLQSVIEGKIKRDAISTFSLKQFEYISQAVIRSTESERAEMEGIPKQRIKLIVVAFILIQEILKSAVFDHIIVSPYALKEGVLSEMIKEH